MKYILFMMLLASCTPNGKEGIRQDNNTNPSLDYRIVLIDRCEYIEVNIGMGGNAIYSLTHKGNCNNTIHPEHLRQ